MGFPDAFFCEACCRLPLVAGLEFSSEIRLAVHVIPCILTFIKSLFGVSAKLIYE